jgi:hypothetical protein
LTARHVGLGVGWVTIFHNLHPTRPIYPLGTTCDNEMGDEMSDEMASEISDEDELAM